MNDNMMVTRLSQPRETFDESEFALIHIDEPTTGTCCRCGAAMEIAPGSLIVWINPKDNPTNEGVEVCATCADEYAPTLVAIGAESENSARH